MQKITVMLVDDHMIVRSGVRRLLESHSDFEIVVEAESGEQAYEFFPKHEPDITLMDLNMPGMGGIESIIRREIPTTVKMRFQQVGIALLLLLMVFVFYLDLTR